jgi:hypothetical protein
MNWKAFAACLMAGVATNASAVYLNPQGEGQALIYPYFTVQAVAGSAMNTFLSIVNNRGGAKAVRVRLREGRNGREVASFNLMLPSSDTWAGAVVPTVQGARLITTDKSCTEPPFTDAGNGQAFLELSNQSYTGGASDGMGEDGDRLREGYVEVIVMSYIDTSFGPLDCAAFRLGQLFPQGPDEGISGTITLINVANGMEFSTSATALSGLSRASMFRRAADPYPDFDAREVDPVAGFIEGGKMYRATTASGLAAVEAVLTKQSVENEIILDAITRSETDWVFTMPTRRFHASEVAGDPFFTAFVPGTRDVEAYFTTVSREGPPYVGIGNGCNGTCQPLGSRNGWMVTLPTTAQNGWGSVVFGHSGLRVPLTNFNATSLALSDASVETRSFRLIGLPVVGFMARTFHNGFLNCGTALCQGNYGGLFDHKWQVILSPNLP